MSSRNTKSRGVPERLGFALEGMLRNDARHVDGSLRDTLWLRGLGPEYLATVFRLAHRADPEARLFYNDYGAEGLNPKSEAIYHLLRDLLDADVPVHGVGLQMHVPVEGFPPPEDVAANMERLAGLGLDIHITEMDVRLPLPVTDEGLAAQARVYGDMLQVCLACPACTALIQWGVSDAHSWVPHFFKGTGAALIFDEEYRPKAAHAAIAEILEGHAP